MTGDIAISVRNLSKAYKIYDRNMDVLREAFTGKACHRPHWALKDVSFEVPRGAIVGVIGANGSGKSTLLKIITGVLDATSGIVDVKGRVSAILELGTGFHPDFTGRENIITGGMCIGMSREEIEAKLPWIIGFSELESVIDQPFRTYSSGMQARLTFSTAVAVDPEILIVDEALAAGDAYFVSKCMHRIREICGSGATVLFVSHSAYTIIELCDSAIWIRDGAVERAGDALTVAKAYERWSLERANPPGLIDVPAVEEGHEGASADEGGQASYSVSRGGIALTDLAICDAAGEQRNIFTVGEDIILKGQWQGYTEEPNVAIGIRIDGHRMQAVSGYISSEDKVYLNGGRRLDGQGAFELRIVSPCFGKGTYHVTISLKTVDFTGGDGTILCLKDRALTFSVMRKRTYDHYYVCEMNVALRDVEVVL